MKGNQQEFEFFA